MSRRRVIVAAVVVIVVGHGCARPPRQQQVQAPAPKGLKFKVGATSELRSAPKVAETLGVTFGKELLLVGINVSPSPVVKGKPATLETVWKCLVKPSRNWTFWTHIDHEGRWQQRFNGDHPPMTPTSKWRPGMHYVDRLVFVLPPDLPGGAYSVSMGVYAVPAAPSAKKRLGTAYLPEKMAAGSVRRGTIAVAFSGRETPRMPAEQREPKVAQRLGVRFGEELLLVGCTARPSPTQRGKPASLEIVWKCLTRSIRHRLIWICIGDPTGKGAKIFDNVHRPALPVIMWEPGRYYRDKVDLTIPSGAKPGKYRVLIWVYGAIRPDKLQFLPDKLTPGGKREATLELGF